MSDAVLQELFSQLEHLIICTFESRDSPAVKILPNAAKILALTPEQLKSSLQSVRRTLVLACKNAQTVQSVYHRLVTIGDSFTAKHADLKAKSTLVHSADDEVSADVLTGSPEGMDDSDYFVLETIFRVHEFFSTHHSEDKDEIPIPDEVINFCYQRLDTMFPMPVRFQACQCFQAFSRVRLPVVLDKFLTGLRSVKTMKKDQEIRSYTPYQSAHRFLCFSVADEASANATLGYFTEMVQTMPKVDRGVLRKEMCSTMTTFLTQVVIYEESQQTQRAKEWTEFSRIGPVIERFWTEFAEMYNIVQKWSKKSKHQEFSCNFLQVMLCVARPAFFVDKKGAYVENLMKTLRSSMEDKVMRDSVLITLNNFLRDVRQESVNRDMEEFTKHMTAMIAVVFPRRVIPLAGEVKILEDILYNLGTKHLHYCVSKVLQEILERDFYTLEQKAIALKAVGRLSHTFFAEMRNYNFSFGPLVTPFIEMQKQDPPILLRSVLTCFPVIENPSKQKMDEICAMTGRYLRDPDEEVHKNAATSLREYLEYFPSENLIRVLGVIVTGMSSAVTKPHNIVRILLNFQACLEAFVRNFKKVNVASIDSAEFVNLRVKFEGCCLMWIAHSDAKVRNEAYRLLRYIARDEFRSIAEDKSNPDAPCNLFMADYLASQHLKLDDEEASASSSPFWLPEISTFLNDNFDRFAESIQYAWKQLAEKWDVIPDSSSIDSPEWMARFRNNIMFLSSAAARNFPPAGQSVTAPPVTPLKKGEKEPVRESSKCAEDYFYFAIQMLQHENSKVRAAMIDGLEKTNTGNFEQLFFQLRLLHRERTGNKKSSANAAVDSNFEESILNLVSRLFDVISDAPTFFGSEYTRSYIEDILDNWTNGSNPTSASIFGSHLTPSTWKYAVKIVDRFVEFLSSSGTAATFAEPKEYPSDISPLLNRRGFEPLRLAIFEFLSHTFEYSSIEAAGVTAMVSLLSLGPLNNRDFTRRMLTFFDANLSSERGYENDVIDCLTVFLRYNPGSVDTVVANTFAENMENKAERIIPIITTVYFRALLRAWTEEYDLWINERGLAIGKILFISLLQQCSPIPAMREISLKLARLLLNSDTFNPGFHLPDSSDPSPLLYTQAAVEFSKHVAANYPEHTHVVIYEASKIVQTLSLENRDSMIRVIIPWAANYTTVLGRNVEETPGSATKYRVVDATPVSILRNLQKITRLIMRGSAHIFGDMLERVWKSVVSGNGCKHAISEIVHFIVDEYEQSFLAHPVNVETQALCKTVIIYLCRSDAHCQAILDKLIFYLRNYKNEAPPDAMQFLIWQAEKGARPEGVTYAELAAFHLLVNLTYEKDLQFVQHLPVVLLNALILFNAASTEKHPESNKVVENVIQSIAIRCATGLETRKDGVEFKKKVDTIPNLMEKPELVCELIGLLAAHNVSLFDQIGKLSFRWAFNSTDRLISIESYRLFSYVNQEYDYDLMHSAVLCIFGGIRERHDRKISTLMELLKQTPSEVMSSFKCLRLLARLSFTLLQTFKVEHFSMALDILLTLYELHISSRLSSGQLSSTLYEIWDSESDSSAHANLNKRTAVLKSACVLHKGLTNTVTSERTLRFISNMVCLFAETSEDSNSEMMVTALLGHALRVVSFDGDHKASANAAAECVEFIRNSGYALAEVSEVFERKHAHELASAAEEATASAALADDPFIRLTAAEKKERSDRVVEKRVADVKSFFESLGQAFAMCFPSDERVSQHSLWFLSHYLRDCAADLKMPTLYLISSVLPNVDFSVWNVEVVNTLVSAVSENVYSTNTLVVSAAQEAMQFLLQNVLEDGSASAFDYLRPAPVVAKPSTSVIIFNNGTEEEQEKSRREMMTYLWTHMFELCAVLPPTIALENDEAASTMKEEAAALEQMLSFKTVQQQIFDMQFDPELLEKMSKMNSSSVSLPPSVISSPTPAPAPVAAFTPVELPSSPMVLDASAASSSSPEHVAEADASFSSSAAVSDVAAALSMDDEE